MADIRKTIEIVFNSTDNTEGFKSIHDGVESVSNVVSVATEPLANLARYAEKTELAVIALGTAMVGFAVNEAGQMVSKVNEIGTLFDATSEQSNQLRANIQTFAQDSTSAIDKINNASYIAISTGTDWKNVTDLLVVAEQGAIAGATDLEVTTAALSRTMNAYGLNTGNAASVTANAKDVMDALFVGVQSGDTTMQALADNLGKVATTAAAAKVPIPDLVSSIAGLTAAGFKTEETMTLLKAVLKELIDPPKELAPLLKNVSLESDGLKAVMDTLKTAVGGNTQEFYRIFGSAEAAAAAIALADDKSGIFASTLERMVLRAGKVSEAYELMRINLDLVTQNMINNFEISSQKIGEPLLQQWIDIIKAITDIFKGVTISVGQGTFEPVFIALNEFGALVESNLQTIARNLPAALQLIDWSGLIDSFKDLGSSLDGLFDGIDISTPKGLADAIQLVVDSIESLTRFVSGIVESWGPAVDTVLKLTQSFNEQSDAAKKGEGALAGIAQQFELFKGAIIDGSKALDIIAASMTAIAGIKLAESLGLSATAAATLSTSAGALTSTLGSAGLLSVLAAGAAAAQNFISGTTMKQDLDEMIDILSGGAIPSFEKLVDSFKSGQGEITNFQGDVNNLSDSVRLFKERLSDLSVQELNEALSDISANSGTTVRSIEELAAAFNEGKIKGDLIAESVQGVKLGLNETWKAADEAIYPFEKYNDALSAQETLLSNGQTAWISYADGIYEVHHATNSAINSENLLSGAISDNELAFLSKAEAQEYMNGKTAKGTALILEERDGMFYVIDAAAELARKYGAVGDSSDSLKKASDNVDKLTEREKLAIENTQKIQEKLLELASDERIKAMEFTVELKTAELEAQTEQVKSAFQSITDVFASSAEEVDNLIQAYLGTDKPVDKEFFKSQIDRQIDMQESLVKSQTELNKSIIELNYAYAESLLRDTIIKIETDGVEPALDALLFEVLKRIQTRIVGDKSAFLLGSGRIA